MVFETNGVLKGIENTDFLQSICLLASKARRDTAIRSGIHGQAAPGITCKRKDILRLTLADYQRWADKAQTGYILAAKLIFSQKIFSTRDLPYRTQLTPLAAILTELGERSNNDGVRRKLLEWFWCGVFGELYGGAIETRFAKDLPEVLGWIEGGAEPSSVTDATFARGRLLTLRTRNSAAYKGLSALLLRDGGEDFRSGQPIDVARFFDENVDIHHIFPQLWCKNEGIEPQRCDSIVNKTPLSAKTNRSIGGRAPSKYLRTLENQADIDTDRMNEIIESHVIDAESLRADNFEQFFQKRSEALLQRIQAATGRSADQLAGAVEGPEPVPTEYEIEEADGSPTISGAASQFIAEATELLDAFQRVQQR